MNCRGIRPAPIWLSQGLSPNGEASFRGFAGGYPGDRRDERDDRRGYRWLRTSVPAEWSTERRRLRMRKLIVGEWMSLDGVVQAPGDPGEDTSGGFKHGGWHLSYFDDLP